MTILGPDTVVYGVTDIKKARRFYDDWGLQKTHSSRWGTIYETLEGSRIILRPQSTKDLPPPVEKGSTVREVIWAVDTKKHLRQIENELSRDRDVRYDEDGVLHSTDSVGFGLGFRVNKRRKIKPDRAPVNAIGKLERVDERATFYERAVPQRIGHVVFGVDDFRKYERFYLDRLGFEVSDRYIGRGVFMRCSKENEHHNLFLINTKDGHVGFHHLAFAVRDIYEVLGGGLNITKKGWKTWIGPGRHRISSAVFWYFDCPAGGAAEYYADSDWCTENWKPERFEQTPDNFAEWALAEGIKQYGDIIKR